MNLGRMIREKDRKSQTPVCGRNEYTEFSALGEGAKVCADQKEEACIKLRRAVRWASLEAAQESLILLN